MIRLDDTQAMLARRCLLEHGTSDEDFGSEEGGRALELVDRIFDARTLRYDTAGRLSEPVPDLSMDLRPEDRPTLEAALRFIVDQGWSEGETYARLVVTRSAVRDLLERVATSSP